MKILKAWSQGDLVIVEQKIPQTAIEETVEGGILLRGEATGHAHRIIKGEARYFRDGNKTYAYALTDLQIGHEDHPSFTRTIPAKTSFRYHGQREADWLSEVNRNVAD